MGRLRRLETLINKIVPSYSNVHLVPRGLPFYTDALLRGEIRYARRTGATLAVVNPDVSYHIEVEAMRLTQTLVLDRINRWLEIGSIITIGPGLEYNVIDDIIEDENRLNLQYTLAGTHGTNERVELYATPIIPSGPAAANATQVFVFSKYKIVNGDQLTVLQSASLLNSVTDITIEQAYFIGPSAFPDYPYSYRLDLAKGIPIEVDINTTPLYLRCNPSYVSNLLDIPTNPLSVIPLGPFVVDYISGMLRDEDKIKETFSIRGLTSGSVPVVGTANTALEVPKNYAITAVPVPSDVMLFWDIISGTLQYDDERRVWMQPDGDNHAAVFTEVYPPMAPGTQWEVPVRSDGDCTLRVKFGTDNDYTEYAISGGVPTTVIVGTTAGDAPVDNIEFVLLANTTNPLLISDWRVVGDEIRTIEFNLTAEARGEAQWQATGLIIKPLFYSLDYVKLRYNNDQNYNGGNFYF